MKVKNYIQEIQIHLITTHSKIFEWFNESEGIKKYRPIDKHVDQSKTERADSGRGDGKPGGGQGRIDKDWR